MQLEGIHHVTAITADAPGNLEFYKGLLGLRLVKKTVNQDDPTVYHLFYADQKGSAGSDITFFEYPGAHGGQAGAGMIHTIAWRVGADDALDFWEGRLSGHDVVCERNASSLSFRDREGLRHELLVAGTGEEPLSAESEEIPREHALLGFEGVRAYAAHPETSESLLRATLGFEGGADGDWRVQGEHRSGYYAYDAPPDSEPVPGAGTVHHVAFASRPEDHEAWHGRVAAAGAHPTPVIDRFYFRSIYFREPSGVLMEIATIGPGFAADEDPEHLGERLSLPPRFESLRAELEQKLTPLPSAVARS
jgi:glyoxalase family protein